MDLALTKTDLQVSSEYGVYKPESSLPVGIYLVTIIFLSFVANSLVILVIFNRRQRIKATHVFIVGLAASDICFSMAIHPMLALTSFGTPAEDIFSQAGCDWYGFGAIFFGTLSMLTHGTISYSRYKTVVHPTNAKWRKIGYSVGLFCFNVAVAFFFAIAPVLGWGRYETFEYGCTVAFHDSSVSVRSYVIVMLVAVLITLALTVVSYTLITYVSFTSKLHIFARSSINRKQREPEIEQEQEQEEQEEPEEGTGDIDEIVKDYDAIFGDSEVEVEEIKNETGRKIKARTNASLRIATLVDRKLTRLTVITSGAFIFAWAPFAILSIWETLNPPNVIPTAYRIVASLFCKSATIINPIIYFFMSRGFRRDLGLLLSRASDMSTGKRVSSVTRSKDDVGLSVRASSTASSKRRLIRQRSVDETLEVDERKSNREDVETPYKLVLKQKESLRRNMSCELASSQSLSCGEELRRLPSFRSNDEERI